MKNSPSQKKNKITFQLALLFILFVGSCAERNVVHTHVPYEIEESSVKDTTKFVPVTIMVDSTNHDPMSRTFDETKLSAEESKLYQLINFYRDDAGIPRIPISKSLTYVAQQHCYDLIKHKPDTSELCNAHSWSNEGFWTPCCYTEDYTKSRCMWNKPQELTPYPEIGFENVCGTNDIDYSHFVMTADYALKTWINSPPHNDILLGQNVWSEYKWNAVGVGIYRDFACVWFGAAIDPAGEPLK